MSIKAMKNTRSETTIMIGRSCIAAGKSVLPDENS